MLINHMARDAKCATTSCGSMQFSYGRTTTGIIGVLKVIRRMRSIWKTCVKLVIVVVVDIERGTKDKKRRVKYIRIIWFWSLFTFITWFPSRVRNEITSSWAIFSRWMAQVNAMELIGANTSTPRRCISMENEKRWRLFVRAHCSTQRLGLVQSERRLEAYFMLIIQILQSSEKQPKRLWDKLRKKFASCNYDIRTQT